MVRHASPEKQKPGPESPDLINIGELKAKDKQIANIFSIFLKTSTG